MKKVLVIVILLALAGGLAWRIYPKTRSADGAGARGGTSRDAAKVPVELAPVETQTIRDAARFSGSLVAKSYFLVAPKVPGRLDKLLVDIGDEISSGELIAILDDDEYAQQVEQARAELAVASANVQETESALKVEQREFERVQALREKKISSESDFDAARARYEALEARNKVAIAQVAQRDAALAAAAVRLSYTKIAASWEDPLRKRFIGERFVDEGAMLRANDPIVSVIDISTLTAVVYVIERDYSRINVGQEAVVTVEALPGKTFSGRVMRVAPLLRESSRQARVEIELPNDERLLKPGMFALVQLEFGHRDNATVVPVEALARREGRVGVFTVDHAEKKAHFVPVTVGVTTETNAEILDPPLSGFVATLGQHLLFDGVSVILPAPQDSAAPGAAAPAGQAPSAGAAK